MDVAERRAKAESLRLCAAVGDTRGGGPERRGHVPFEGFELRESSDGTVNLTGWASVTERPYSMGFYTETIARGAFRDTLSRNPDVKLKLHHEGFALARTVGGSLRLAEDDRGLHVDATLNPNDVDVQQLREKVNYAGGMVDEMSFAFSGARSEWNDEYTERRIVTLDIHRGDVAVVSEGASEWTSFAMRAALSPFIAPTDAQLSELRELLSPSDIDAALANLTRLRATPAAPTPEPVEPMHLLDAYRARAFALRARGKSLTQPA